MSRREETSNPGSINAVLGRGSSFEGKLNFEGTVRIEGKFGGEIHTSDTLVIGEGAEVKAEIFAGTVIVSGGRVTGNIRAKTLIELEKEARVYGSLESPAVKIDRGVIFEGTCKMEKLDEPKLKPVASVEKA
ncbi:bactofilin family protein [Vulgatibacter incomptus]